MLYHHSVEQCCTCMWVRHPLPSQARSTQNQPTTGRGIPSPRPQLGREMLLDIARWRKGCENASNQTTQHLRALVFSILRYFSWFPSQRAQRHLHTCNFTLMIGSTGQYRHGFSELFLLPSRPGMFFCLYLLKSVLCRIVASFKSAACMLFLQLSWSLFAAFPAKFLQFWP